MESRQPTTNERWVAGLASAAVGAFLVLEYCGVLPWTPYRPERRRAIFSDPYHWQILAIGLGFLLCGAAFLVPQRESRLGKFMGACVVISFAAGIVGSFLAR